MIRLTDVCKSFDGHQVLENINLEIPDGSRLCLVGGSGSGKSVLIKMILGLESPDSGKIEIDGVSVSNFSLADWREVLNYFGVVFQGAALFDSLSVFENVGIKLIESREFADEIIQERAITALESVNLSADLLNKYPAELSGGMRKRVGIARAIIHDPRVLVYDEPTTGLDPVSAGMIDQLIRQLAEREGRTSIIVTHDMETVRNIATQVAMLYQKRLLFNGTKDDFLASHSPIIKYYLSRGRS